MAIDKLNFPDKQPAIENSDLPASKKLRAVQDWNVLKNKIDEIVEFINNIPEIDTGLSESVAALETTVSGKENMGVAAGLINALKAGSTATIAGIESAIATLTTGKASAAEVSVIRTVMGIDGSGNPVVDADTVVNRLTEMLSVFQNFNEGADLAQLLNAKLPAATYNAFLGQYATDLAKKVNRTDLFDDEGNYKNQYLLDPAHFEDGSAGVKLILSVIDNRLKSFPNFANGKFLSVVNNALTFVDAPTGTVTPGDSTAPSLPTNLQLSKTTSTVTATWTASTDNSGVAPTYNLSYTYGGNTTIVAVTGTTYTISGIPGSTAVTVKVQAKDGSNNLSAYTSDVSVTTDAPAAYTETLFAQGYFTNEYQANLTGGTGTWNKFAATQGSGQAATDNGITYPNILNISGGATTIDVSNSKKFSNSQNGLTVPSSVTNGFPSGIYAAGLRIDVYGGVDGATDSAIKFFQLPDTTKYWHFEFVTSASPARFTVGSTVATVALSAGATDYTPTGVAKINNITGLADVEVLIRKLASSGNFLFLHAYKVYFSDTPRS